MREKKVSDKDWKQAEEARRLLGINQKKLELFNAVCKRDSAEVKKIILSVNKMDLPLLIDCAQFFGSDINGNIKEYDDEWTFCLYPGYAYDSYVCIAAAKGDNETIKILVDEGKASLKDTATYGDDLIIDHTPLTIAANNGYLDTVNLLHKLGADINEKCSGGCPAILYAVANMHISYIPHFQTGKVLYYCQNSIIVKLVRDFKMCAIRIFSLFSFSQ